MIPQFFYTFVLILLFSSQAVSFSQDNTDGSNSEAMELLAKAKELGDAYQFDSSIYYYEKALSLCQTTDFIHGIIRANASLGACYTWQSKFDMAKEKLNVAINLCQNHLNETDTMVADCHFDFGFYYGKAGEYENQLRLYEKSIDLAKISYGANHRKTASYYGNYAVAYQNIGDYQRALEYLQIQEGILQKLLPSDHIDFKYVYNNMGTVFLMKGDHDRAESYFIKAINLNLQSNAPDLVQIASGYVNLGVTTDRMGNHLTSLNYFSKADSVFRKILPSSHVYFGIMEVNKASALLKLKNYNDALYPFSKAKYNFSKNLGNDHPNVAKLYINLAECYKGMDQTDSSLFYLKEALSIQKKALPKKHRDVGITLNNTGMQYAAIGQPHQALEFFQKALIALVNDFEDSDIDVNPKLDGVGLGSRIVLLEVLSGKASTFIELYNTDNSKEIFLLNALETYELAEVLIDKILQSISSEESQKDLTSKSFPVYEGGIYVSTELNRISGDEKYLEKALHFSSKSKSFLLKQAIRKTEGLVFGDVPDHLIEKERTARIRIAFYQKKLDEAIQKTDSVGTIEFQNLLFRHTLTLDSLNVVFQNNYPNYHQFITNNPEIALSQIQSHYLDSNTALIEYFDGDSIIYVFSITDNRIKLYEQSKPADFNDLIANFKKTLADSKYIIQDVEGSDRMYIHTASQLYKLLLQKPLDELDQETQNLIIVPSGLLGYVNYEALISKTPLEKENINYRDMDFLIKKYRISYLYSMLESMYSEMASSKTNGVFGGFGVSDKSLPGADEEVISISKITNGDAWTGEDASESNVKQKVNDYSFIHFSAHGSYNDTNPLYSKLILSNSKDPVEDDTLFVAEIYSLQLGARLSVLSACETGDGELSRGEGIMSMARAFAYAGSPSVVTSLWKVDSRNAKSLMTGFYKNLNEGFAKNEALHKSKLHFLNNSDQLLAHPHFWASFILIGDNSTVEFSNALNWQKWLLIVVALAFVGLYLFRKPLLNR